MPTLAGVRERGDGKGAVGSQNYQYIALRVGQLKAAGGMTTVCGSVRVDLVSSVYKKNRIVSSSVARNQQPHWYKKYTEDLSCIALWFSVADLGAGGPPH